MGRRTDVVGVPMCFAIVVMLRLCINVLVEYWADAPMWWFADVLTSDAGLDDVSYLRVDMLADEFITKLKASVLHLNHHHFYPPYMPCPRRMLWPRHTRLTSATHTPD